MPVPKFRTSASKRDMRRSHHALKGPGLGLCPQCGDIKQPHIVCHSCGFYRGDKHIEAKNTSSDWNTESTSTTETKSSSPKN